MVDVFYTTEKELSISDVQTLSSATLTSIKTIATNLPKGDKIRLRRIQGSFGIQDDPTDELIRWMIAKLVESEIEPVDVKWEFVMNYRSIGTDSGPIQTMDHIDDDIDDDEIDMAYQQPGVVNAGDQKLSLMVVSTTTSQVRTGGSIRYEHIMRQRQPSNPKTPSSHATKLAMGLIA